MAQRTLSSAVAERTDRRGPDECWPWLGVRVATGYGVIMRGRRNVRATHVALEQAGFPRPLGASALHSCDNPSCVNPAHLRWGTQQENVRDCVERGRQYVARGEGAGQAKLADADIRFIRSSGETSTAIANHLGVSVSCVSRVRLGRTWAHLK